MLINAIHRVICLNMYFGDVVKIPHKLAQYIRVCNKPHDEIVIVVNYMSLTSVMTLILCYVKFISGMPVLFISSKHLKG